MARPNRLHTTQQENLVSLLLFDEVNGKIVNDLVETNYFEGGFHEIVLRVRDYYERYGRPPGVHVYDLLSDILDDPHDRRAKPFKETLQRLEDLHQDLNVKYVLDSIKNFKRFQRMKDAVIRSARYLDENDEAGIEEVDRIWNELLKTEKDVISPGVKLTDYEVYFDYQSRVSGEFTTGIKELDRRNIVPSRGEVSLFIASAGMGKTWWLVHLGKRALIQRKRVLHISLEMPEPEVMGRYYQSIWGVTKRSSKTEIARIKSTRSGAITGISMEEFQPEFELMDPNAPQEVKARLRHAGRWGENMRIIQFPPRSKTVADLEAYIDFLERSQNFIPDLILVDYLGILKTDANNHRITLGRAFEELRGLAIRRNVAIETAHQSSKMGAISKRVGTEHVAEDWSLIGTTDRAYTYSSTSAEKRLGLARFFVAKARKEEDQFGVLITQNYNIGQFVNQSTFYSEDYWSRLDELSGNYGDEGEEDGDGKDGSDES